MFIKNIHIKNTKELETLAITLSNNAKIGDVITFKGNLGAGKTTFIKFFIQNLIGKDTEVTSPTFNLLHTYPLVSGEISHFDLYRLKNLHEAYELGIEDAFIYSISLIEWPEIIEAILPKNKLAIEIAFNNNEQERIITLSSHTEKWVKLF